MRRAGSRSAAAAASALAFLPASVAGPALAAPDHAPSAPIHLTVDDDAAPLAVTGDPAFGWVLDDPDRGEVQTSYEIQLYDAATGDPAHRIAGTQQVHSDQQSTVHVPDLRLDPDRSYWWTVRTWDSPGQAGPASALARFDTGLSDGDWRASWIRRPGAQEARLEDYSLLRREVAVAASLVVRARVYASAGHQFDLRVNGARRAHGPSYAYPDEQYYETTDVTSDVEPGAPNVFAFITWWGQPGQGRPESVPALIARITIDHVDGTREVVTTDSTWRTRRGPWVQDRPRNDEGDFVEHIDAALDPVGWDRPGFDDAAWTPAAVLGTHPTEPFLHLYAARTHIVEQRMKPVSLTPLPGGGYVADFGAVVAATPVVALHHGVAGTPVLLVGGYELDPDGRVSHTRGIQDTNMTWKFDERDGVQELRPFGYLAFRYLEVDGHGEPLGADDVQIDARHASFPDEHAASFETSDSTLNAVWDLARHSALYGAQEQFVDTPTREKGPFLGDSFNLSQAAMAAFGDRALTSQALRDFARSQVRYWSSGADRGRVNVVYPNGDGKRDIPDATQIYPEWVWQAYWTTGDRDQLASLYPVVRNITDYVARAIDPETGLVTQLPGGGSDYRYGAVDWPPWMRFGYDMKTAARTMMNVLAVADFRRAAAMGQALGRPTSEIQTESARTEALTRSIQARLTRPDGVLVDGLRSNGTQSTHASQQANAWALAFGIVPPSQQQAVADHVVSLGNAMGVVYFRVLLDALHEAGRDEALVAALTDPNRPGYAQILNRGATFTWESWNAPDVGDSESHGWGSAVLAVLQEHVLGVHVTEPGAARVDVRVPATSVARAAGVVATQRGPIPIAWTRDPSGHETIDVTIPVNVTATVHLPAADVASVNDGGRSVVGAPGISSARPSQDEIVLTVGSGHYVFANSPPAEGPQR